MKKQIIPISVIFNKALKNLFLKIFDLFSAIAVVNSASSNYFFFILVNSPDARVTWNLVYLTLLVDLGLASLPFLLPMSF